LLDGRADLLIVYGPAPDTRLNRPGINHLDLVPIGSDALVFIVNADNPIDDLTVEQVRDIYAGRITNWAELGGPSEPIAAFQRNPTAGSHALLLSLLMQGAPLMIPPQHYVYAGMGGMLGAVAEFDGGRFAIGYNVFYYVTEMMRNPHVKVLRINGVAPSQETIGSGAYPLSNHFYAVVRPDEPKDSPAYLIRNWLLGPEGQALIDREGYAAIKP
jgi:ABC-type phosphate transport system substrate-binding protein